MARPKGSISRSMFDKLAALMERDLAREILADVEEVADPAVRAALKIKLMEFVMPKRKAVEHSGEIEDKAANEQRAEVKKALDKIAEIEAGRAPVVKLVG